MNCERRLDLIDALLEDELDEPLSEKAELHIFACRTCRTRYETLRQAKEIYAQYLFDVEPPPDSLANFQARLEREIERVQELAVTAGNPLRRIKSRPVFGFSPATALAAILFLSGTGFVWLQLKTLENDGNKYAAEIDRESPPAINRQTDRTPSNRPAADRTAPVEDTAQNKEPGVGSRRLKAASNPLSGRRSFAPEAAKAIPKNTSSSETGKSKDGAGESKEPRLQTLQRQNLETEIAGQLEKVELLLRSFRNARSNETTEGFDVEYEKKQARQLLDKNARLRRGAENYGLFYSEELLSRVEPYLLDIANLENNPSTDRVAEIRKRVGSQNIIASLQVYSRDQAQ